MNTPLSIANELPHRLCSSVILWCSDTSSCACYVILYFFFFLLMIWFQWHFEIFTQFGVFFLFCVVGRIVSSMDPNAELPVPWTSECDQV